MFALAEGGHNARLQGPRRYGKTSILKKLLSVEAERAGYRAIYVDFLAVTTSAEVARRLHEAYESTLVGPLGQMYGRIKRGWRGRLKAAPGGVGVEAEQLPGERAAQQLADLLDLPAKILARSGERSIVVFDEFQDFLRTPGELAGLLRSKMQNHVEAASYIFCASDSAVLDSHFSDRDKPLFDQARPFHLTPLADVDLGDYITATFSQTGREVGEALDPLLDLVRGHPQRAMLASHHLWEETPPDRSADLGTFDGAMQKLDRELKERFEYTWDQLVRRSGVGRVLKALALSPETLYNQRTLLEYELGKSQAAEAEKFLKRSGEVWEVDSQPQLIDPLFERWIQLRAR